MTGNNPKLDLFNVDVHKKIGQILSGILPAGSTCRNAVHSG